MADDFFAFLAGVGIQVVVAGDAVRVVLHLDVFASAQGLVAVFAAELVTHDVFLWPTSFRTENSQARFRIHYLEGGGVRLAKRREEGRMRDKGRQFLEKKANKKHKARREKKTVKDTLLNS